mmetsp:Transcript_281/g.713  ORF Transcript_281/g.713 Transcript_281/m.713 type:complete len:266 (-) Transcript_281:469-1266(-)
MLLDGGPDILEGPRHGGGGSALHDPLLPDLEFLLEFLLCLGEGLEVVHLSAVVVGDVGRLFHPALHVLVQHAREGLLRRRLTRGSGLGLLAEELGGRFAHESQSRSGTCIVASVFQLFGRRVRHGSVPFQQFQIVRVQLGLFRFALFVRRRVHRRRSQRHAEVAFAVQFPTIIDLDGIQGFVLANLPQFFVEVCAYEARTDRGTGGRVSKLERDLEPLRSLFEQRLKRRGRRLWFRLLLFPFAPVFSECLLDVLFSLSFLLSLGV